MHAAADGSARQYWFLLVHFRARRTVRSNGSVLCSESSTYSPLLSGFAYTAKHKPIIHGSSKLEESVLPFSKSVFKKRQQSISFFQQWNKTINKKCLFQIDPLIFFLLETKYFDMCTHTNLHEDANIQIHTKVQTYKLKISTSHYILFISANIETQYSPVALHSFHFECTGGEAVLSKAMPSHSFAWPQVIFVMC